MKKYIVIITTLILVVLSSFVSIIIYNIRSSEIFNNKNATYNELLLRKIMEVHYIEDISEFLTHEYNRLK